MSPVAAWLTMMCAFCGVAAAADAPGQQPKPLSVLLIDGDPGQRPRDSGTFYLRAALEVKAPGAKDRFTISQRQALDLSDENLPRLDVIVLCNVAELTEAQTLDLEVFLRRGGGVLIFLGEKVNAEKYNRTLYRDGKGPLPAKLDRIAPYEKVSLDLKKSAFAKLAPLAEMIPPKIQKAFALEVPKSEQVRTLCTLSTGDAVMVEKQVGRGKCLLVATTCNADWNNLPKSPLFVPLMDEALRSLAPKPKEVGQR